jgi:phosphohistidine phosphatase
MMWIVLLRHAEAEDQSLTGLDADRKLTASGEKRARLIGKIVGKVVPPLEKIFASPLLRARQTAGLAAEGAGFKGEINETSTLRPGAAPAEILAFLRDHQASSVLLVGHQPHLGALFGRMVTGGGRGAGAEVPMKKASIAVFEVNGDPVTGEATLVLYAPAKVLERLA